MLLRHLTSNLSHYADIVAILLWVAIIAWMVTTIDFTSDEPSGFFHGVKRSTLCRFVVAAMVVVLFCDVYFSVVFLTRGNS